MIEILKAKIETLSPNQRQLIAVDEGDMLFYILSDIAATIGRNYLVLTKLYSLNSLILYPLKLYLEREKYMSYVYFFHR